ncbi:MAG: DUF3604 domain-containing protein [Halieaceae bacterium]
MIRLFAIALSLIPLNLQAVEYTEERAPCDHRSELKRPFFGDLHVHTRYSLDASTQGTRTTPEQSYRFAKGENLGIQPWDDNGQPMRSLQLRRPLDFAMVSDHAELIGEVNMCNSPAVEGYSSWQCRLYRSWPRAAYYLFNYYAAMEASHMGQCGENGALCRDAARAPWQEMGDAAEQHYDRSANCHFTTFVGYEWTGVRPASGGNLHRNVVFRNAEVPELPISFIEQPYAEGLWRGLETHCQQAAGSCDSLVIPHNANISAGEMFSGLDDSAATMTAEYAELRGRMEPLVEIMQHKGASECYFAPDVTEDELCSFEQQPTDNIASTGIAALDSYRGYDSPPQPDTGFVRSALIDGLLLESRLGVNPYRFGFIASTDTHLGTPGAVEEDRFLGHGGAGVPAGEAVPAGLPDKLEYNPGGLAVVWAKENSRDALFDAMQQREAYGTSGPRIISRFFAGWDYPENLCDAPDAVAQAYEGGVAMGGQLPAVESGQPRFLVYASQDNGTADSPGLPLQRLQLVKGWLDKDGRRHEQVLDVAGDANNGAGVDTETCATHGEGAAQLCAVWTDRNFDADQSAFYYSRAVENPSCRWSQRICVANGVNCDRPETIGEGFEGCCAAEHRPVVQERAWTSPIWYTPAG